MSLVGIHHLIVSQVDLTWQYPHRLTSAVIDGVLNTFVYDAAGNTTRYNAATGDDTVLDYDARGQVEHITLGLTEDKFWYGPNGERFLKQATWDDGGSQVAEWTLYLAGGAYEELHPESDPDVLYRQQVQVTETVLHRRTVDPLAVVVTTFEYGHRDHLGSVDKVTDESGNVLTSLAFDPFGGRRDAAWTQELIPAGVVALLDGESTTKRGFTDHEHLDRTGFIHMNGRVYDPRIGRFTSPDPFVQSPTFSQSYNRYAYVLNSPMSLIDPSGYTEHWVAEVPVRNPNPAANFGWNFSWPGEYVAGDPNSEVAYALWEIQNERVFVSDTTTFTPAPADPAPDPVDPDPMPESPPQTNPTSSQSPGLVDEVWQSQEGRLEQAIRGKRGAAVQSCRGIVEPCTKALLQIVEELVLRKELRSPGGVGYAWETVKKFRKILPGTFILEEIITGKFQLRELSILGRCQTENYDQCTEQSNDGIYPNSRDLRAWELKARTILDVPLLEGEDFITELD